MTIPNGVKTQKNHATLITKSEFKVGKKNNFYAEQFRPTVTYITSRPIPYVLVRLLAT